MPKQIKEKVWNLYYLYDPRNQTVCYIGLTSDFNKRMRQHIKPLDRNKSPIACLQRYLIKDNKSLCGAIIATSKNKYYIEFLEKSNIRRLRNSRGRQIKNVADGGFGYRELTERERQAKSDYIKNNPISTKRGEDLSNLTDENVRTIYSLINMYYSNTEIEKSVDFGVTRTQICNIRAGVNWSHLFKDCSMIYIPSIPNNGGYNGNQKIDIIDRFNCGQSVDDVIKIYNNLSKSDLSRIKDRKIWDKAYHVYDNYFKK